MNGAQVLKVSGVKARYLSVPMNCVLTKFFLKFVTIAKNMSLMRVCEEDFWR